MKLWKSQDEDGDINKKDISLLKSQLLAEKKEEVENNKEDKEKKKEDNKKKDEENNEEADKKRNIFFSKTKILLEIRFFYIFMQFIIIQF